MGVSPTPRPPLSLGKTRYPLYRRLGGPQGRFGRAENLAPTGIRSRTVQPVAQSLYRLSCRAYYIRFPKFCKYPWRERERGKGRILKLRVWMSESSCVNRTNISAGHIVFGRYRKTDIASSTDVGFVVDGVAMWQVFLSVQGHRKRWTGFETAITWTVRVSTHWNLRTRNCK